MWDCLYINIFIHSTPRTWWFSSNVKWNQLVIWVRYNIQFTTTHKFSSGHFQTRPREVPYIPLGKDWCQTRTSSVPCDHLRNCWCGNQKSGSKLTSYMVGSCLIPLKKISRVLGPSIPGGAVRRIPEPSTVCPLKIASKLAILLDLLLDF